MSRITLFAILFLILCTGAPLSAHAQCTSPAGVAGSRAWFAVGANPLRYHYCDGTNWVPKYYRSSAGAACPLPAQKEFDDTDNLYRVCNADSQLQTIGCVPEEPTCTALGTWAAGGTLPNQMWNSITYGNGRFVTMSSYNGGTQRAYYSADDGVTWTVGTTPNNTYLSIAYHDGVFVAVGASAAARSVNGGQTFTAANTGVPANNWQYVAYVNGQFMAVASDGTQRLMVSTDMGQSWTPRTLPRNEHWQGLAYGNGVYVIVGHNTNAFLYSSDGITWNEAAVPSASWKQIAFGNGRFVAVNDGNTYVHSTDGITWTHVTAPTNGWGNSSWNAVVFGGGRFMVSAWGNNMVRTSTDGINWTAMTGVSGVVMPRLAYGNGVFIGVREASSGTRVARLTCTLSCAAQCPALGSCTQAGAVEYLSASNNLAYCNGTQWTSLGPPVVPGSC